MKEILRFAQNDKTPGNIGKEAARLEIFFLPD
jgi:hypothetical protein